MYIHYITFLPIVSILTDIILYDKLEYVQKMF